MSYAGRHDMSDSGMEQSTAPAMDMAKLNHLQRHLPTEWRIM